MTKLTKRRLLAIQEALHLRLSDELTDPTLTREDYEAALRWAEEQAEKRGA